MDQHSSLVERLLDWLAAVIAFGTLINALPNLAALFTIMWTGLRIWETDTVRGWFGRRKRPATEREEE